MVRSKSTYIRLNARSARHDGNVSDNGANKGRVTADLFERLSGADPRLFDPQNGTIRSFEDISYLNLLSRDTTVSELKATQDIFASLPDAERNAVQQSLDISKRRNASTIASVARTWNQLKKIL